MSKARSFKVSINITATAVVSAEVVKACIEDYQKQLQRARKLAEDGSEEGIRALKIFEDITPYGLTEENFDEYFPRFIRANFRKNFRESREIDLSSKEWKGVQAAFKMESKGGAHE